MVGRERRGHAGVGVGVDVRVGVGIRVVIVVGVVSRLRSVRRRRCNRNPLWRRFDWRSL